MSIESPTEGDILRVAETLGIRLSEQEVESYRAMAEASLAGLSVLDEFEITPPTPRYARGEIVWPATDDNILGAWYVKCRIEGGVEWKTER